MFLDRSSIWNGDDRFSPRLRRYITTSHKASHVRHDFEAHTCAVLTHLKKKKTTKKKKKPTGINITEGEVEVPVLNNAPVTYFHYLADSTSFIRAWPETLHIKVLPLYLQLFPLVVWCRSSVICLSKETLSCSMKKNNNKKNPLH